MRTTTTALKHFWLFAAKLPEQWQPSQKHASSTGLHSRPMQSHINQDIADSHHPYMSLRRQCHRILASERTVEQLLISDVDSSIFGVWSCIAGIRGKIFFSL